MSSTTLIVALSALFIFFAGFLLVFSGPIAEQGSLVVCLVSKSGTYVVVASESRRLDLHRKPVDDSACKIVALDKNILFLSTGYQSITMTRGSSWNSLTLAKSMYRQSPTKDALDLSRIWGKQAAAWFRGQSYRNLQALTKTRDTNTKPITILAAGFAGFTKGPSPVPSIQSQDINFTDKAPYISHVPTFTFNPPGAGAVAELGIARPLVDEFIVGRTSRAVNAASPRGVVGVNLNQDIDTAIRTIQFAIDNSTGEEKDGLGGPIDLAILRNDGIEWINRKQNCYGLDEKPPKTIK